MLKRTVHDKLILPKMKNKINRREKECHEKPICINYEKFTHTGFKDVLFSRVKCLIHQHTIAMFLSCKAHS